jgi:hypothetical protein
MNELGLFGSEEEIFQLRLLSLFRNYTGMLANKGKFNVHKTLDCTALRLMFSMNLHL